MNSNKAKILVLNGPNLNLLGTRESSLYGNLSLEQVYNELINLASSHNIELNFQQSNAEYELINSIHNAKKNNASYILLNAAAYSHTSIALRDALLAIDIPFIEIHISNVHAREAFRQKSYLSDISAGVITGLGTIGYKLGLIAAIAKIEQSNV